MHLLGGHLADYELLNQKYNGLEVIRLAQISRAILVTNFISQQIILKAEFYGVKILPKSLASEVNLKLKI